MQFVFFAFLSVLGLLDHVKRIPENQGFRFGNGGRLVSRVAYLVPVAIGNVCGFLRISAVPSKGLGWLLGDDFLRDVGGKRALGAEEAEWAGCGRQCCLRNVRRVSNKSKQKTTYCQ